MYSDRDLQDDELFFESIKFSRIPETGRSIGLHSTHAEVFYLQILLDAVL